MPQIQNRLRVVPCVLALGLVAVANAQITNVTSQLDYNNEQRAYDSSFTYFGNQQQFVIAPNPPTTDLTSPLADYVFTNPGTGGSGELTGSTDLSASFGSTSTEAVLNASGFATAGVNTADTTSTYDSDAATEADLMLDVSTYSLVTFSTNALDSTNGGLIQFGADNSYVGDFLTSGSHSASKLLAPGSHFLFTFLFADEFLQDTPGNMTSSASGDMHITVQSVPEPAPMAVLGLGALGLLRFRRRK